MARQAGATSRKITRRESGVLSSCADRLAVEEPLEIRVDGHAIAVTMRTPGHDVDLAAGFCLTEGIVQTGDEIDSIEMCSEADYGNIVGVRLTEEAGVRRAAAIERATREMSVSSSCGLCSKQTIDQVAQRVEKLEVKTRVEAARLEAMAGVMCEHQTLFDETGGIHAAAIFTGRGDLRVVREDVGRHNAVDKAIGYLLMREELGGGGESGGGGILFVSGRAGFEIVQKAAMAGIGVVCAVGAPSSMAVDFSLEVGQTLIGFLRENRMNIYAHGDRLVE